MSPQKLGAIDPPPEPASFPSRRSVVYSTKGMVACSQPLAVQAGLQILREGGNAADAAVAVAAALNMTEPASTGIGGDMFALYYCSKDKEVRALNGSGRAPGRATLEQVCKDVGVPAGSSGKVPMTSIHAVTTPGAAAGWVDVVETFGNKTLSLAQILEPAIDLGEHGFPVSELSASFWKAGESTLRDASPSFRELLKTDPTAKDGVRAPRAGELFKNHTLANTFRLLAEHGKEGFYRGPVCEAIVEAVQARGGCLDRDDLQTHLNLGTEEVDPIFARLNRPEIPDPSSHFDSSSEDQADSDYGVDVWECPPNGQGIVALMAFGILKELEKTGRIRRFQEGDHNCCEYLHAVIESLRIAFADASWWVTDPAVERIPSRGMLSPAYLAERAKLFNPQKASGVLVHGSPAHNHSDTVYFAVTDQWGNAMSFVNSNFGGFGSGIVPAGCGFTLHNRGASFDLQADHPNVFAPNKRPYHTIIPAMVTLPRDGSLHMVYGVMGGYMQPQGHVQVLLNMLAFKHNPQAALDAPRICIGAPAPIQRTPSIQTVFLEQGIAKEVAEELRHLGHQVEFVQGRARKLFGRGQIIRVHVEEGQRIYSGGSDPRGDGAAFPL